MYQRGWLNAQQQQVPVGIFMLRDEVDISPEVYLWTMTRTRPPVGLQEHSLLDAVRHCRVVRASSNFLPIRRDNTSSRHCTLIIAHARRILIALLEEAEPRVD
jgi:hypothetical protein